MEITVEIQKRKKWEGQRAALAEQIQAKHEAAENEKREDPTYNNPHARSESLMVLYKKEKAKQLYQEQLMLMRQKKEYQSKISEIDTRHSLDRLVLARKEYDFVLPFFWSSSNTCVNRLEKDLKAIKVTKYQQRKSLEIYWKQQVGVKKNAL